jgi:hypothetical protein
LALRHEDVWWRGKVYLYALTLALHGGKWLASRPARLTPKEKAPSTHSTGGWVDHRRGVDAVAKEKIPVPAGNRNTVIQPVG